MRSARLLADDVWAAIFGTGSDAALGNTYEWTYAGDTSSLSHHPAGWCRGCQNERPGSRSG